MNYFFSIGAFILLQFLLLIPVSIGQANLQPPLTSVRPFSGTEQGSFKILFGGEVIGQERFQIVGDGNNFKASAEIRLTVERGSAKATFHIHPVLQFTKSFEPLSYQILQESGANTMRARVNFKPGKSQAVYETGKETDAREIELKKDVLVLDDNVFHHYILLARRFDFSKGGVQEFNAFVPQQFMAGSLSVEDKGFEQVTLGDQHVSLQHLLVETGELQMSLWLDSRHELQKISVPKSNVDVVRE
jgi:hypothetical protein